MNPTLTQDTVAFCPCCGTNIARVAFALQYGATQSAGARKEIRVEVEQRPRTRKLWSEHDRTRLWQLKDEGKKPKEIAAILKRPIGSVCSQVYGQRPKLALMPAGKPKKA